MTLSQEIVKPSLIGVLGLLSAAASNRRIAIYHDGLRTVVNELSAGTRTRRNLARYAYTISFSFIVASSLPYSLATGIIIIHIVCLGGDIIGMRFERTVVAAALGFVWSALVTTLVDLFGIGLSHLPLAVPNLHLVWVPLAYTFPLLGAIAAGQWLGFKPAAAAALFTLVSWAGAHAGLRGLGVQDPQGVMSGVIALAAVSIALLAVAIRSKASEAPPTDFFEPNIIRIRRNWRYLVPIAALLSVAASQRWLAGEPIQAVMLGVNQDSAAAMVALFSMVGFLPLQAMTGLISGVWNQDGYPDWLLGAGYVIRNPFLAAAAGASLMAAEILSLRAVGRLLTTRPAMTELANAMRDALEVLPSLAILAGGVWAAISVAGPAGACTVVAASYLNDRRGRPVPPMAVPVIAYLAVALVAGAGIRLGVWS